MTHKHLTIGRKAENLYKLKKRFPALVPHFEVVEMSHIINDWHALKTKLNIISSQYLTSGISQEQFQTERDSIINSFEVNTETVQELEKVLHSHGFSKVSFRTSAVQEDLVSTSFAGQYVTFLDQDIGVTVIKQRSIECAKSLFSDRVISYMKAHHALEFVQDGSIIVQKMYYGTASGVLFTENGKHEMSIAYTPSWRNTTVDGKLAFHISIHKSQTSPIDNLPSDLPRSILEIIEVSQVLEEVEGHPLDIEWAVTNDSIALLQYRPITTLNLQYSLEWDNTNIAESYPGITLPLTYSFIRKMYANVYPEFLKLLGKSNKDLESKSQVFENMLGYVQGRVYYNIENWYRLVAMLPGYQYNKGFFEAMLVPAKNKNLQNNPKEKTSLTRKIRFSLIAIRFILLLLRTDSLSKKFVKRYTDRYERYKAILWDYLTAENVVQTYHTIETDLLEQWAVPILNDFRTMIFHGMLKQIFFAGPNSSLYTRVLSGIYDHTSVEPIRELSLLAHEVVGVLDVFKKDQKRTCHAILHDGKYAELLSNIQGYLTKYGGRSPDELKLENPRLGEDLPTFVQFVVSTADGYTNKHIAGIQTEKSYMEPTSIQGSLLKKYALLKLYRFLLYQTKKGISQRERFRFYRAQVYGIARKAYLALGNRFVEDSLLEQRDDVFYLSVVEIHDIVLGHALDYSVKSRIVERKKLFTNYAKTNKGRRAISTGVIAPRVVTSDHPVMQNDTSMLKGLGVSSGIFRGEVVVVQEFDPKANVKGKVLVTEHTDPGWTLLFLNASALIVERGNALSHASIVSREIGIPAVVAVEDACTKLKDHQEVIVNGDTGEITIV